MVGFKRLSNFSPFVKLFARVRLLVAGIVFFAFLKLLFLGERYLLSAIAIANVFKGKKKEDIDE